jgi:hypothetical protein
VLSFTLTAAGFCGAFTGGSKVKEWFAAERVVLQPVETNAAASAKAAAILWIREIFIATLEIPNRPPVKL